MTARTPIRETSVFEAPLGTVEKSCNVTDPSSTDSMRFVRRTTSCKKVQGMASCLANHNPLKMTFLLLAHTMPWHELDKLCPSPSSFILEGY